MKSKYITQEAILRNVISSSNIEKVNNVKRYATVKFDRNSIKYTYLTNLGKLKKGDSVLLDSSTGLGVGKFIEYVDEKFVSLNRTYSWILCKLDLDILRDGLNESRNR